MADWRCTGIDDEGGRRCVHPAEDCAGQGRLHISSHWYRNRTNEEPRFRPLVPPLPASLDPANLTDDEE